jgi:hypothetical protein
MENSAGAMPGFGHGHHILARKFRHMDLLVKEAAEIDLHPNNINRQDRLLLHRL